MGEPLYQDVCAIYQQRGIPMEIVGGRSDGKLVPTQTGKDSLEVNATLEHFPLRVANVFIPDKVATLAWDCLLYTSRCV